MRYLKTIWVVTLALLWMPITSHCQLESIPSLTALLSCCEHDETSAPHEDQDCKQDACASVESGDYRTQEHEPLLLSPDQVVEIAPAVIDLSALPDDVSQRILTTAPPEQRHLWHFVFRTALPVRAPSFAS